MPYRSVSEVLVEALLEWVDDSEFLPGQKFWISPSGKIHFLKYSEHVPWIAKRLGIRLTADNDIQIFREALEEGWIRVVYFKQYRSIGFDAQHKLSKQRAIDFSFDILGMLNEDIHGLEEIVVEYGVAPPYTRVIYNDVWK
jgi:hypothetical protein